MLYDDWPAYPMSCGAQFSFSGKIRPDLLEQSFRIAVRRHPLLNAVIENVGYNRWSWLPAVQVPTLRWLGSNEAYEFARCAPFDLEQHAGLRVWVQQNGKEANVYFEFHHACCDGAGGLGFTEDIFALYASGCQTGVPDESVLPPIDHSLLHRRGVYHSEKRSLVQTACDLAVDAKATGQLLACCPAPLAHRGELTLPHRQSWRPYRFISRQFCAKTLSALRAEAVSHGATLNDILVRDLFQSLDDWNRQHQAASPSLRVVVPVNLRCRADLAMPAANRLSYSFLTRKASQMGCQQRLLQSIQQETSSVRRAGGPRGLLAKLSLLQKTRIGYSWVLSPKRCFATAVFSNLGDPTRRFRSRFPREDGLLRIGDLILTDFAGTTALRPKTHAGFFFNTYGNRLTISTRFDPAYFSVDDAQRFLSHLTARFSTAQTFSVRRAA